MKVQSQRKYSAFTLIEMIGVLAVIAILAALLLPKVFVAINNARINNAAVGYNAVKGASTEFYTKYGTMKARNGVALNATQLTNFAQVLLEESFMDKPFQVKIGTSAHVEVVDGLAASTAATTVNAAYDLDGAGVAPVNDAGAVGSTVVQAVIEGVQESDAKDLNDLLDGSALGSAIGADDIKGRVKYAKDSPTTVYIYVNHR